MHEKIYSDYKFCSGIIGFAEAQSPNKPDIPLVRVYFHEKIDSTQKIIKSGMALRIICSGLLKTMN